MNIIVFWNDIGKIIPFNLHGEYDINHIISITREKIGQKLWLK